MTTRITPCPHPEGHRERTLHDTTAGIIVDYHGKTPLAFHVHCLKCCHNFGPYRTLAGAQAVGRECSDCAVLSIPAPVV